MGHQMLGQIRRHNHPSTIVHGASDIKLAHRRINKLKPRAPSFPRGELGAGGILAPGKGIPSWFPVLRQYLRCMVQQVIGKLAPHQFFQEGFRARIATVQFSLPRVPALRGGNFPQRQIFRQF